MPGDLLTRDYQFQLVETLYGCGSGGVSLDGGASIDGLGVPDAKTQDVVFNLKDGSYANPDYVTLRTLSVPIILRGTPSAVMTSFKALTLDWVPQTTDVDLSFQLPGWGKFYVLGRPRGVKADLKLLNRGAVRAILRFDCPDPTITYL